MLFHFVLYLCYWCFVKSSNQIVFVHEKLIPMSATDVSLPSNHERRVTVVPCYLRFPSMNYTLAAAPPETPWPVRM